MLHFDAAESQVVIAVVVKRVYVLSLNRLLIGTDDVPPAALVVRERRVIGLTQIRTLANRRKSLELDGNDLSPQSQSQCAAAQRFGESDEGLLDVEPVLVNRLKPCFTRCDGVLELREELDVIPESKVRMPFEPAEDPLSALAGRGTEERRVIELKAFPKMTPRDRYILGCAVSRGMYLRPSNGSRATLGSASTDQSSSDRRSARIFGRSGTGCAVLSCAASWADAIDGQ